MTVKSNSNEPIDDKSKDIQLGRDRVESDKEFLTTEEGVRVENTDDSLKVGERGPTLLETSTSGRRSRASTTSGSPSASCTRAEQAAHGYFQVYESLEDITKADFLWDRR